MKFYYKYTTTYHNNTKIGTNVGRVLLDEEPQKEITNLTWDNLDEQYYENGLTYQFNIWNFKRGRRVSFFVDKMFFFTKDERDVKEWEEDLNVRIEVAYEEFNPSIDYVLKWHDPDRAIAYLKEKGLTINA